MKHIFLFILVFSCALAFGESYCSYYFGSVEIYRSLQKDEKTFFSYSRIEEKYWTPPNPKIVEIRAGEPKILLVHGIDPSEIYREIGLYKEFFIDAFLKNTPQNVGIYMFIYPSLDSDLAEIGNSLATKVIELNSKFFIYAHSMGGIVLKYALRNEQLCKFVEKVIFAGTPHKGSPWAIYINAPSFIIESHKDSLLLKTALLFGNTLGVYIKAPNYYYLIPGIEFPELPEGLEYLSFVAQIDFDSILSNKRFGIDVFPRTGLWYLASLSNYLYGKDSEYSKNDGMVPVESASALGNVVFFNGFDHFDLVMNPVIVRKAVEYFLRSD